MYQEKGKNCSKIVELKKEEDKIFAKSYDLRYEVIFSVILTLLFGKRMQPKMLSFMQPVQTANRLSC